MSLLLLLAAGLLAGLVHVVTGPDHLVAVAPLAVDQQRSAWRSGMVWGLGHACGSLAVGLIAILARGMLPIAAISAFSERLVGVVLIAIGALGIAKTLASRAGSRLHRHRFFRGHRHDRGHGHLHVGAAFPIGVIHALAGGSHLLGVLPSLIIPTTTGAIGYLVAFAAGSIAGMAAWAHVVGWATVRLSVSVSMSEDRARQWLLAGASSAALALGCVWLLI